MNKPALWFSTYYGRYGGNEQPFYAVKDVPVAQALEKNYPQIREELKMLWDEKNEAVMGQLGDYQAFDDKQFPPNSWQKIVFKVWGLRNEEVCKRFPFTAALIDQFPNLTSCFVTKLKGHAIIKSHCGETNAHYRVHLGLHVPDCSIEQCGMEVANEKTGWANGKVFVFLDARYHHVWNNTDQDRYVLIVDILRPDFVERRNFVSSRVIVNQIFMLFAKAVNIKFIYGAPNWVLNSFAYLLHYPILLATKAHNRFGLVKL